MVVYSKIVKYSSVFTLFISLVYILLTLSGLFCKDSIYTESLEFVVFVICIVVNVTGGIFEALVGEKMCCEILRFTPLNLIIYSVCFLISIYCFYNYSLPTGFIALGLVSEYKLIELSCKYRKPNTNTHLLNS